MYQAGWECEYLCVSLAASVSLSASSMNSGPREGSMTAPSLFGTYRDVVIGMTYNIRKEENGENSKEERNLRSFIIACDVSYNLLRSTPKVVLDSVECFFSEKHFNF